ncbi:hypothetical protein [Embleya sp. NPDC059237]|uniref:hypothetical protein n=1 Tax=Embleya sp. NPDC059237 TaxID=3346784 RepID=UPI0036C0B3B1
MSETRPLSEVFPEFYIELIRLLHEESEHSLAGDLHMVRFHDWCECTDDFCQSFRTAPAPDGAFGPGHRTLCLLGEKDNAMINIDLVHESVAYIEVIGRPKLKSQFRKPN